MGSEMCIRDRECSGTVCAVSAIVSCFNHIPCLESFRLILAIIPNLNNLHPSNIRARNKGRSTDNVRTDCGFDPSNFRLAGHVDRSKFNRIENEINLRFLLFSCFSCYLSSRCVNSLSGINIIKGSVLQRDYNS